jgi:hypothetical protein
MTDPSPNDLSPAAAQGIVKAFDERYELLGPLDGNWQEVCIAAALRAAADVIDFDPWLQEHADYCMKLLAIAAELEAE